MDSILPPDPFTFWFKRRFCGMVCPALLVWYGIHSLITGRSYAIGASRYRQLHFVEVTEFKATLMGVAYIGFAIALFSYCYAPYSKKLSGFSSYGEAIGLLLACIGIVWCSWLLLIGN